MQEFFMDYGLWLLIALLVVIGLVFLLSGRKPAATSTAEPEPAAAEAVLPEAVAPPSPAPTPVQPPVPVSTPAPAQAAVAPDPLPDPTPVAPVVIESAPPAIEEPPVATPPKVPAPAAPSPALSEDTPDDLLKLKGVGPKLRTLLIELGITRYAQIAAWTDADIATLDAKLGTFKGRPVRDQWVDQAKYLAASDIAGFEAKYGKL